MYREKLACFLCTVCFMLAVATPGYCAQKPTCAVLMFNSDETLAEKLNSRYITGRFAETLGLFDLYEVLDQGEMIKKISAKKPGEKIEKCADVECAVDYGKLLNMDYVLYGVVGHIGSLYSVETSLVDVKTGGVVQTAVTDFEGTQNEFAEKVPLVNLKSLLGVSELPKKVEVKAAEAETIQEAEPPPEAKKLHIGPRLGIGASDDGVAIGGGLEVRYSNLTLKVLGNGDGIAGALGYYLHVEGNSPYIELVGAYYDTTRHGGNEIGRIIGFVCGYRLIMIDRLDVCVGLGVGYDDWDWNRDHPVPEEEGKNSDSNQEFIPLAELTFGYMF